MKRIVWVRDLGRCAFIGTTGHRCNERRFVQFHHVDPYALGGEATVDKIELRCRRHNDYEGRLYFGKRRRSDGGLAGEPVTNQTPPVEPADLFRNTLTGPDERDAGATSKRRTPAPAAGAQVPASAIMSFPPPR